MQTEGHYLLETPENVEISFELAGPGSQFCALIIDYLLMALILMVTAILAGVADMFDSGSAIDADAGIMTWLSAAMVAAVALLLFGYGFCFEVLMDGQIPGKRHQKLRVLRDDGTPATALDLAIRNLLRIVDSLPGFYAVGGLVSILSTQQKRLGDLAAGTIVVKESELDYRANADKKQAVVAAPVPIANVALDAEELRLIRGFLERRAELIPEARTKLAEQLGRRLHTKHGGQYDDGEMYLLRLSEGRHFES